MSSKVVRISIALLCLLALLVPSPANSAAGEISSAQITTPSTGAYVSTEVNPTSLSVGGTTLVSVKLNNVPVEGYKSAEFTCTYSAGLLEKSNITFTNLFGAEPVTAIHDPQNGAFIVAIAGMNSNRAMTSGVAFTFSAKGLQAGQSPIQCAARVSTGNNLAIDVPSIGAILTILDSQVSPTPFVPATATPEHQEHPTSESPTPVPTGSMSGQILASKPVTIRLLDVNQVEITWISANPDGTFIMTSLPGDYVFLATASGFLSYQGMLTISAGNETVFPLVSLLAGDVDGNDVIDQFDALTIGMSYTSSTPEAADLNNDVVINFLDLELLAENYRQTGPTVGSSSMLAFLLPKKGPTAIGSPTLNPNKTVIAPTTTSFPVPGLTQTVITPAPTRITGQTGPGAAFLGAPLCPSHDPSRWHGLWDSVLGCHYDHEHGLDPFTPAVAAAFPGFDLRALLGNVTIGHTNPSSPVENTHKHGGFKWQVNVAAPLGCRTGFEDGTIAVKAYAIQYHVFGRQDVEHEARNHSSTALLAFCKSDNPSDVGYMYVVQLQEYGQRVTPYQGFVLPYPDTFQPAYISPRGPYFTNECVGQDIVLPAGMSNTTTIGDCRDSLSDHLARNGNVNSIWTSKPTGNGARPETPKLFRLLFRVRDGYQLLDSSDLVYPFTWKFMCSSDGGQSYNASMPGCRWNSSTSTIHEVMGDIPAAWDGLAGFDTDPRPGRITAQGFVTRFGDLNMACTTAGGDCYPIKLVSAFVGRYSSELSIEKVSNPDPFNTPERDIYFCNGVPCSETSPGAVPSGWIGSEN